ncbi:MAG: TetR/AcrR family transcriptional regulator [Pseudomonadota bacterium]
MHDPLPGAPRRRKPTQSRARATTQAIEQAFVALLVERGYARVTIRQVLALAGVGVGSFYEYFASKEALAAQCIRQRVRAIAAALEACLPALEGEALPARVDAMLAAQVAAPLAEPEQWAALFHLERQVSKPEAFREGYAEFVALWERGLGAGADWPADAALADAAFAAHAIAYSLVAQTLMARSEHPDPAALRALLRKAVHGYLSAVAPRAYRSYLAF